MILDYFQKQIEGGATVDWFYLIESNGDLHIKRHRGGLDTFPTNLKFTQMRNGMPEFSLDQSSD